MHRKFFTLSYDDGVEQDKRLIEIFDRHGLKCTFNVNSGFFGQIHTLKRVGKDINHNEVPRDEFAQVYMNHEVATHSVTHPELTRLDREQIISQVLGDRKTLSELVGYDVTGHAYPCGCYDRRVSDCLRDDCGITYARTGDSHNSFAVPSDLLMWHPTCRHDEPRIFELLDEFAKAEPIDGNLLFNLYGHAYEFDYETEGNTWEHIERICEKIAGRDDIVYCTNGEFVDMTSVSSPSS